MRGWDERFAALAARRTQLAAAPLAPVRTVADHSARRDLLPLANAWSALAFDGPFFETRPGPALSAGVVFVRSRRGDTATRRPAVFGAGAVDEHLIYEGLTRVDADAVAAGAATLHPDAFFSVWRPELIELRLARGLPRHPAQVVLSHDGSVRLDSVLLFNVPAVPVFVITSLAGRDRLAAGLAARPWVTAIAGGSLREQFARLREAGIRRVSSVGGRRSASALVDADLVQDVYLTTTEADAGDPGTPWYVGNRALKMEPVLAKTWDGDHGVVRFEHCVLAGDGRA